MIDILTTIVREAGKLAQEIKSRPGDLERQNKAGEWDFATEADHASQTLIIKHLQQQFPGVAIVAEEDENPHITEDKFFVVDPIDGTGAYSSKRDTWGITIAYLESYQPKVGAIFLPDRNVVVTAVRGQGCQFNGHDWQFKYDRPLAQTLVNIDLGPWVDDDLYRRVVIPVSSNSMGIISTRSAVASTVEVLEGKSGVYCNVGIPNKGAKIWDFAAGVLAVEEAGGVALTHDGKQLQWNRIPMQAILAATRGLADEVVSLIRRQ